MFPPLKSRVFRLSFSLSYPGAIGIIDRYIFVACLIVSPGLLVQPIKRRHIELLYYTLPRVSTSFMDFSQKFVGKKR